MAPALVATRNSRYRRLDFTETAGRKIPDWWPSGNGLKQFGWRHGIHFALKNFAKMCGDSRLHFVHRYSAFQQTFQRCSSFPRNSARYDQIEVAQVRGYIVREAVRCHPAAQVDANRTQFFFLAGIRVNPQTMASFNAPRRDSEFGRSTKHGFFQHAHVPTNIATMPGQIQDRVAHDLPWTMVGDVAATVRLAKLDIHLRKQTIASSQMFRLPIAAERDHMRVLAEQQHVGNFIFLARRDGTLL